MAKKWVKKMKKAEAEGDKVPAGDKPAEKAAPKKNPLHDNPRS